MTEANFARARKVILCAGLLVAALLFLFPHWRLSSDFADGEPVANQELGRIFIAFKPFAHSYGPYQFTLRPETVVYIHNVRQFIEIAIALLLTFGLMRALRLKKPARD
jgi:hypothetical protein